MFLSHLIHKARVFLLLRLCLAGLLLSLVPPAASYERAAWESVTSSRIENSAVGTAPSSDLAAAFLQSSWIWTMESDPPNAPPGTVAFQKTFTPPAGKLATHTNILMTADDQFSLFVDGNFVVQSPQTADTWRSAQFITVAYNSSAPRLFAVNATSLDPGPAGLLATIQMQFSDGTSSIFATDSSWIYTTPPVAGWNTQAGDTFGWSAAQIINAYGLGIWGDKVTFPTAVSFSNLTFDNSLWIWSAESNPPNAPPGPRAFRKTFTAPSGQILQSASVILTVDNEFTFYVNGELIGGSPNATGAFWNWKLSQWLMAPLSGTSAVFAVNAINLSNPIVGGDNPAGFLATICITFTDGSRQMIVSDTTWKVFGTVPTGFQNTSYDDSSWATAHSQGTYGVAPWNNDLADVNALGSQPTPLSASADLSTTFISSPTSSSSVSSIASQHKAKGIAPGVLAGTAIASLSVLLALTVGVYLIWCSRKQASNEEHLNVNVQSPYTQSASPPPSSPTPFQANV
ncbi:hypothetical protein D9619_003823 [Psilocybe cf. subviscida]|uniref:Uncharacterized protein n=1 Tax=Psilocybe cf. subviscida TaxID=2480587 RepID=A0A8H5AWW3_9AGAR|nr:hypothetical protein D9619_003823 [Psilocybe cf. subviscida]